MFSDKTVFKKDVFLGNLNAFSDTLLSDAVINLNSDRDSDSDFESQVGIHASSKHFPASNVKALAVRKKQTSIRNPSNQDQ